MPLPAADTSAEELALGAALNSADDVEEIRRLSTEEFAPGRHRDVFHAILAVADRGLPVTPHTVLDELDPTGEKAAGAFLHKLYAQGAPGTAAYFVDRVTTAARSRRILQAGQCLGQLAGMEPGGDRDAAVLAELTTVTALLTGEGLPDPHTLRHEREVIAEARKIRARDEARRLVVREQRGHIERPRFVLGAELLAEADPPVSYRVDRLWPTGGRILLAAQYKAGKTTLVGNLIRSLTDADDFLDQFHVTRQARRVALIDNELDRHMIRRWLREQGIERTDLFAPVSLRGKLSTFDILDPQVRTEWAADLRELNADVLILDCLRPVLDALGLDENREAGRLLTAFDELLGEAGVSEAVVVHHMGHNSERSRGDSRLRDWPDVEWRLVREDAEDPASPRYFSAFGRDVDVPESQLTYDASKRRLTLAGGNRRDARGRATLPAVLAVIAANPEGISGRGIEEALSDNEKRQDIRSAIKLAVAERHVITFTGPRRATMHVIRRTECASAPECATSAPEQSL
jgi:hypothetical protein